MDAAIERLVAAMDSSETDASLEQVMARRRGDISPLDVVIRKAAGYTFVLSVVGRNVLLPLVHTSSSAVKRSVVGAEVDPPLDSSITAWLTSLKDALSRLVLVAIRSLAAIVERARAAAGLSCLHTSSISQTT